MKKVAIVGGLIIVVAVVGTFLVLPLFGDTTTGLELNVAGGACTIVTNVVDKDVSVKKNKKITWTVKNACPTSQTIMLGNFRVLQPSTVTDCANATAGGAAWPFKDDDQTHRSVTVPSGGSGNIVLKEAKNAGGTPITYYFDVCLGGVKKDPQLVIEP